MQLKISMDYENLKDWGKPAIAAMHGPHSLVRFGD